MDFNTGSSGSSGSPPPPPRQSGPSMGGSAGEFNLSDPVQSFISTVRGVVLDPVGFFRSMKKSGDFVGPLVFALICVFVAAVIGGVIGAIFSLASGGVIGANFSLAVGSQGIGGALVGFVWGIIRNLIVVTIALFVGAGILHLLVILFLRPNHAGYETTFRVGAYAYVVYLVSWIPILGWLLSLYAIFLAVVGIREVHNTTTGKAALIVLIPVAVVALLFLILLLILVLLGVGAAFLFNQQGV